ncbi:diguanylate cyclase [Luteimonas sp. SDU82]|uniref:diguanylate cyclase n=1 Tax=Luteimonas sp. SDU82 TaxID=3422592 RepID=UPI003EB9349C
MALGVALLLWLLATAVAGSVPQGQGVPVALAPLVADATSPPGADGPRPASLLMRFELPAAGDGSRWVVRLERSALDAVWLQRGDWRSETRSFFSPIDDAGLLPSSFLFTLPAHWQGPVELELHAHGSGRRALRPEVMDQTRAMRLEQYGVAASAMIYACLFTIGLLALALYSAARDRLFLGLFGFALATLLTLSAVNGHLYQFPGLRLFAFWRSQGVIALSLLLCAAWLQMLLRYVEMHQGRMAWKSWVDGVSLAAVALAGLCLLNLPALVRPVLQGQIVAYCLALLLALALLVDGGRRRIAMAWPMVALTLCTLAGVVFAELAIRGHVIDTLVVRYGYQLAIALGVAILAVGLVGRIREYRYQRDRELLARADTERRMARETARSDLAAQLQAQLRALPAAEMQATAFRLLIDRLLPLLPVQACTVVVQGYHGLDLVLAEPSRHLLAVHPEIARRQLALRRQAAGGVALQQPVTEEGQSSIVAMEAVVPLQIRAPAWGVLLLRREGGEGFATEELSLAGEFAQLAVQHVDQAVAAVNLRRSAELDALTGSLNRRTIDQWLARSFAEAARDQQPVSVLFIDLDHFKAVNDRHGHAGGDFCLRHVAVALRGALEQGDLFGRYGGEEFIAVLPGRNGAAARVAAEHLRMAVENLRPVWNGKPLRLTVSVGVATRLPNEDTPEGAVARADRALYAAKSHGRNCVQVAPAVFT